MKNKRIGWLLIGVVLLSACTTEVDLCYGDHPHRSLLDIRFNWNSAYQEVRPDSMYVVAFRPLNQLKYGFLVSAVPDAVTNKVEGQLLFPLSELEVTEDNSLPTEPEVPANPDKPTTTEGETGDGDPGEVETPDTPNEPVTEEPVAVLPDKHKLWLRNGEYTLITYNGTNRAFTGNLDGFATNEYGLLNDIVLTYKAYETLNEYPDFSKYVNWIDRNPYSGYVLGEIEPIFYHTIPCLTVPVSQSASSKVVCNFTPQPITQEVTVQFEIEKKEVGVKVDSIQAEMSGLPSSIQLSTGSLSADKTYKVLFSPTYTRTDSLNNMEPLSVKGQFHATGIVRSYAPSLITGPGIMQVCVYTQTEDDAGRMRTRVFKAGINLYNLLKSTPSVETESATGLLKQTAKEITLVIKAPLQITRDRVLENAEGGLDYWVPGGTVDLDI